MQTERFFSFPLPKGQVSQASPDFTDGYYGGKKMEQRRDLQESRRLDDQGFQETSRYSHDLQGQREYFHTRQVGEDLKSLRQSRGTEEPECQWDSYREASSGRSEERLSHRPDDRRGYRGKLMSSSVILILPLILIAEIFLRWFLGKNKWASAVKWILFVCSHLFRLV